MKVERTIIVAAPPEQVYAVIMDPDRLGEWVTIQEQLVESPGRELEQGDRLVQKLKVAGQAFQVTWLIAIADRPGEVEWEGEGPLGTSARVGYRLAPEGSGTRFDYANEYELPGGVAGRVAGRAVASMAGREAEKTLERLKRLIEGG